MKNKKNLGRILLSLIVSVVIYIGLLVIQQNVLQPNGTSKVYLANEDITKGTIITDENISQLFKEKKVDSDLKVTNSITDKKELMNKIINEDIEKGQVVSNNNLLNKASLLASIKDSVEVSVKVSDLSQAVGGTIREGDIINISEINNATKQNEKVLEKVYVNRVFSNEGKKIEKQDKTSAVTINMIIAKEDEEKLNNAIGRGAIRISKEN